ncbi:MAG: aminoglycoside 3'-phosphotransferase [Pseudolysinimonas sp.]
MTRPTLANKPEGPIEVPELVRAFASGNELEAVWRNELGGLTFRGGQRYLKWNPLGSGVDLEEERARLAWLAPRHPVAEVLDFGRDDHGQLLVTRALPGDGAVTDPWRVRPRDAVRAIAEGLRVLHALPIADCALVCRWAPASGVPAQDLVVVQGDACAPNTIIGEDARFVGHVDLGLLGVADRWADLAVASRSLDWNYGPGWQDEFLAAYGVARDEQRIVQYRALCDQAP